MTETPHVNLKNVAVQEALANPDVDTKTLIISEAVTTYNALTERLIEREVRQSRERSDADFREQALDRALAWHIRSYGADSGTVDDVLATAERFDAYLRGGAQ